MGIWERLGLTDYVARRHTEALDEVPRLAGESDHEAKMREITYLNLTRWGNFLLDRTDRMGMAAGLEVRVPFSDHVLVEYVFNTPWAMKSFDGREKSLLRAAVSGLLPSGVLNRKKSPYPSTQDRGYELALRARVSELLKEGSPVQELVTSADIQSLLDVPIGTYAMGGPWGARAVLERLVEFNAWMIAYQVKVEGVTATAALTR